MPRPSPPPLPATLALGAWAPPAHLLAPAPPTPAGGSSARDTCLAEEPVGPPLDAAPARAAARPAPPPPADAPLPLADSLATDGQVLAALLAAATPASAPPQATPPSYLPRAAEPPMTSAFTAQPYASAAGPEPADAAALALARRLLLQHGSLHRLARLSPAALQQAGLSALQAQAVGAAFELGRRRQQAEVRQLPLAQAAAVAAYVAPLLIDQVHEACVVLYLNRAHQLMAERLLAVGGVAGVLIDPRIVFREAVALPASALIVCHNHPSGSLQPSAADRDITQRLCAAGRLLDIEVVDHVIVSVRGYFSFAEQGLLPAQ